MWKRFKHILHCPTCAGPLELSVFSETRVPLSEADYAVAAERGLLNDEFSLYVETGVLSCDRCLVWFPVYSGLPVLLPYTTRLHEEFAQTYSRDLAILPYRYRFPDTKPVPGEQFVLRSFSREWLEYDFDGVIWEMDYADHEKRFLSELGSCAPNNSQNMFLELGCGIGITTYLAQKNFGVDAVGVDLSLAAMRAAKHYRQSPFLHFVQASVFYLPFAEATFDTIYSRGVLHHTYSTREAFHSLARFCRAGGGMYLWVYGPGSINDNVFREIVYTAERIIRRSLSRGSHGRLSLVVLAPLAAGYMVFNRFRRRVDPTIQPYSFYRALHAARDRFTPEYAHRQDHREVSTWFLEAGFEHVEVVDWRLMPSADHDDYRRNTGVRGMRAPPSGKDVNSPTSQGISQKV